MASDENNEPWCHLVHEAPCVCAGNSKQQPAWPPHRCQHNWSHGSILFLCSASANLAPNQPHSGTIKNSLQHQGQAQGNPEQDYSLLWQVNVLWKLTSGQISRTRVMPSSASVSHFQRHRSVRSRKQPTARKWSLFSPYHSFYDGKIFSEEKSH